MHKPARGAGVCQKNSKFERDIRQIPVGLPLIGSNFREDVNLDGSINSADIGLVKSKSGTALP